MEIVREFFEGHYPYEDARQQQQVRTLATLNLIAIGVDILLAFVIFMTWVNLPSQALLGIAVLLFMMVISTYYLVNSGRQATAALLFTGYLLVGALILLLTYGLDSAAVLTLVVPLIVAGLLFEETGLVYTTAAALTVLGLTGVVDTHLLGKLESFWVGVLPPGALLLAVASAQRAVTRRYSSLWQQHRDTVNRLRIVTALSEDVTRLTDLETVMADFGDLLQKTFELQQVQIYIRDENNPRVLRLRSGTGLASQRALMEGRRYSTQANLPIAEAFRDKQPVIVRSTDLAHTRSEFLPGTNAQLLLPLQFGQDAFGVLDLQSANVHAFAPETVELMNALTRQFSANIEMRTMAEQLNTLSKEQENLYAHIETSADEIRQLRRQAAGVVWGRFFRDRGTTVLGFDLQAEEEGLVASDSLSPTLQETLDRGEVSITHQNGRHLLSLPIVVRGQTLGAMEFEIQREGELPAHLIDLATAIADRLSLALDNIRLVEETQAFAYRERQISSISTRLQGSSTLEELLNLAAAEFNAALGGNRTQIRLQSYDRSPAQQDAVTPAGEGGDS